MRLEVGERPMDEAREKKLLAKALERGMVSAEQVEACRQLQADAQRPASILTLLLEQGHLSREQVIELITGKAGPPPASAEPEPEAEEPVIEEIPLSEDEPAPAERAAEPEPAPAEEPAPTLPSLEECELVADLGSGPLATACVVRDNAGQQYVLKVLHASVARRPGAIEEVQQQAAAAAEIDHPNIARVLGAGEVHGDTFVLSEYVDGASLEQLIEGKGRLSPEEALAVGIAIAAALERAGAARLRHGAVTPTNILIGHDGTTKLADLGMPKPPAEELSIARSGEGIRSPYYLSPEHVSRAALGVRADLFSLGASLYHALSGQHPFTGDTTTEVLDAIRAGELRPVHDVAPGVPRAFSAIVGKLLRPDPARRYQTPRELMEDLAALHAGKVPAAQRAAVAQSQTRKAEQKAAEEQAAAAAAEAGPATRRRWPWIAAAAALLVALAIGGMHIASRPSAVRPAEKEKSPEIADPVKLAKKGREELARAVEGHKPEKGKELAAARKTVQILRAIGKKYRGTEVAEEAKKKLIPFRAEALFQQALAFARENPSQHDPIAERFREVVARYADTEAAYRAERELDKLEGSERKKLQRQLDQVRQRAAKLVDKQHFGAALGEFDGFLENVGSEDLKQLVLLEKMAIRTKAGQAYDRLHEQAQDKIRGQYYAAAKALYGQVADRFALEPYVGWAKGHMAILEPLLASASRRRLTAIDAAKYEFFLVRIEPLAALARTWQLKQAKQEAEKLRPDLRTAGLEAYLDDYLADLDLLRNLKLRVIRRLNDEARPVVAKEFSLGKVGGKFDPHWLKARVLRADENEIVLQYGQVEVHRGWAQCSPDELVRLGRMATDPKDARGHLVLGIHCLNVGLVKTAESELNAARAGGLKVATYLKRLELSRPARAARPDAAVSRTKAEEASHLFMQAKRYMNERAWDRALYRLALLKARHATKDYDVSASLQEINQRIAQCRKHVDRMEMETDLALGREVQLLRLDDLDDWQRTFGAWSLATGVLRGDVKAKHDGECLLTLRHPPHYELRLKARILRGTGAILRLAGKGRPNLGFWIHAQDPKLVGLLQAHPTDDRPAERVRKPFPFKPNQWYEIRAVVCSSFVEVTIGPSYRVRMPNKLPGRSDAVQTYGLVVNPGSAAEFRDLTVRVLQEQ